MTLAEVAALTIEDTFDTLFVRIMDESLTPAGESAYSVLDVGTDFYDDKVIFNQVYNKPPRAVFDAELVTYKAELSTVEQARLDEIARVDDIKARFAAISDLHYSFSEAGKVVPNPVTQLQRIIDEDDQTYLLEIEAGWVSAQTKMQVTERIESKKKIGRIAASVVQDVLDVIAGHNVTNGLTVAQIDQFESTHTQILGALQSKRPAKAKGLIQAVTPDGTLVTQDMKDDVLAVFSSYGI